MKLEKIWVLFSVENEYDQPPANLKGWWIKKPTLKLLSNMFGFYPRDWRGILSGKEVRITDIDYRLEQIKEGKYDL